LKEHVIQKGIESLTITSLFEEDNSNTLFSSRATLTALLPSLSTFEEQVSILLKEIVAINDPRLLEESVKLLIPRISEEPDKERLDIVYDLLKSTFENSKIDNPELVHVFNKLVFNYELTQNPALILGQEGLLRSLHLHGATYTFLKLIPQVPNRVLTQLNVPDEENFLESGIARDVAKELLSWAFETQDFDLYQKALHLLAPTEAQVPHILIALSRRYI